MYKFKSWFETKLTVGPYPGEKLEKWFIGDYDYIINVSDEWYAGEASMYERVDYFWFPMSEFKKDMGVNIIYGAIIILSEAEVKGKRVYLHCHSGNNRSWTVASAYYYFRTGTDLDRSTRRGFINKLHQNCAMGVLPPILEMKAWLTAVREDFKNGQMKAGILTLSKVNHIKNF